MFIMSGWNVDNNQENPAVKRSEINMIFCGKFTSYQNKIIENKDIDSNTNTFKIPKRGF
jgi:hypothetical protein